MQLLGSNLSALTTPPPPPASEVVLDGFVLLEACRCEDPDEAEKAVLEGCGITSVISEDLSFFRKLSHLENKLDASRKMVTSARDAYHGALRNERMASSSRRSQS